MARPVKPDVAAFAPRRLGRHAALRAIPSSLEFRGIALYIDISGYSRLTNESSRLGEAGLEQLSRLLDQAFGPFIDCAEHWGGEVAVFAGDALLVYWSDESADRVEGLSCALGCIQELRAQTARLESFQVATSSLRLGKPRMGLAMGELSVMHVGTSVRSFLLFGGEAVREATALQAQSVPGEVSVCPQIRGALPDLGVPLKPGSFGIPDLTQYRAPPAPGPVESSSSEPSTSLLPRAVARLSQFPERWQSGQLRPVTALFLHLERLPARESLATHQRVAEALLGALRQAGEYGELVIDDKGLTYFMVFGALLNAAPDDPERAARAALALRDAIESLGHRCCAGLAQGMAYCGAIGTRTRRAYVTVGSPMNLASRLAALAQGRVLLDQSVAALLPADCEFEARAAVRVKGFEGERFVARLVRAGQPSVALFVGRERDLRQLEQWAAEEAAPPLLLVGGAGLGKSRLLEEFTARHTESAVHRGGAQPDEPNRALGQVLASLVGIRAAPLPEIHERLAGVLGGESLALLPLFADLFGLDVDDTRATASIVGEARVDTRRRLVAKLIARLAQDDLLIFEDAHWMGSGELDILGFVAERYPAVRLVVSCRDEPLALERVQRRFAVERLELSPIEDVALRSAMTALLDSRGVSQRAYELITEYSRGNPLALQECVHLLKAAGHLRLIGDTWELADQRTSTMGVPGSVQAMIASRVDYLPVNTQHWLKLASVVGRSFSRQLLERIADDTADSADPGLFGAELEHLVEHHFIERVRGAPDEYRFRHALIRDAAYHLMLVETRRALHARVAWALEPLPDVAPARLAEHFSVAEIVDKALEYGDLAGRVALKNGAYEEAIGFFSRCLELAPGDTPRLTRVRWNLRLADAFASLGDQAGRRRAAQCALQLSGEPVAESPLRRGVGSTLEWLGQLLSATDSEPGHEVSDAMSERARLDFEIGYAHCSLSETCYYQNEVSQMFSSAVAAIGRTQGLGASGTLSRAYATMSILGVALHRGLGHYYLDRAIETALHAGDRSSLCYAHMVNALHSIGNGEWPIVRHSIERCQRLAVEIGDQTVWGTAETIRFWLHFYLDEPQAQGCAASCLEATRESGNRQQQVWAERGVATMLLRRGEAEAGRQRLGQALELYERAGLQHLGELVPLHGSLALAEFACGDWDAAIRHAERTLELARDARTSAGHAMLMAWLGLAHVLCTRDKPGSVHGRAAMARRQLFRQFARHTWLFPMAKPMYWYWKAKWAELEENDWLAQRYMARARRYGSRLSMPHSALRVIPEPVTVPPASPARR